MLAVHHCSKFIHPILDELFFKNIVNSGPLHGWLITIISVTIINHCGIQVVRMKLSFACSYPLAGKREILVMTIEVSRLFDSPKNVPAFLEAVKRREKVLSGFGHRSVHL